MKLLRTIPQSIVQILRHHRLSVLLACPLLLITFLSFINCSATDIFTFKSVSSRDVSTAINALSTGKASSVDNVSVTMLKKSSAVVAPILANLFNLSIATGTFPACLEQVLVVPVHKKGDTCKISNYRLVALLSTVSKLFERLIYSQLYVSC